MRRVDFSFATHARGLDEHWVDPPLARGEEAVIAPGIRAAELPAGLRDKVDKATQERGFHYGAGMRSITYGIMREDAPGSSWDSDGVLSLLLGLSRIVHPSTLGNEVAGTLTFGADGQLQHISGIRGEGAYSCKPLRPWLTKSDFEDLGRIFAAYEVLPVVHPPSKDLPKPSRKLPLRLHRAIWNLDYAAYVQPSHIRWLIIATSLEGIIETGQAARQEFIQRIPAIGAEVGVPITRDEADTIYSLRSTVAHRGWFSGKEDDDLDPSYILMDRFVAGVLRKAIFDDGFRAAFDTKETVTARWPVALPPQKCSCGNH
jgi:hypothetical protein